MGLLEVDTGYRFNMDFKAEERDAVRGIIGNLPINEQVSVNMNYRQSWGSFSQDKMVSWDITVQGTDLTQVCVAASLFWDHFKSFNPLMGYVNMFNIDMVKSIFLEVTNSECLKMLQQAGHITWCLMVAPKIASISLKDSMNLDLEGLDELITIIKDHNNLTKGTRVKDGGNKVDRVVLGLPWMDMQDVKARTNGSRVFWDRFWKNATRDTGTDNVGTGGNMTNRDTNNEFEVLVTMFGFQHQANHAKFYLAFLQNQIGPYLKAKAPQGVSSLCQELVMVWTMTGAPTVFKLTCNHHMFAKYLCVDVVDMEIKQEGNLGTINFKSSVNNLKKTDWSRLFSNLMIQDVSQEFTRNLADNSPTGSSSTTPWELAGHPEATMGSIQE